MSSIYFAGNYKPMMCGIADYTSFITGESPPGKWGVLSFDLNNSHVPLARGNISMPERVWYVIPDRYNYSPADILYGLGQLGADSEDSIIWFQHENGIWPDNEQFVNLLRKLDMPRIITFHTLHFQSAETPNGLRINEYNMLEKMLPHVEAVTVFSKGVFNAVSSAFPEYQKKIHILKHGIHSYPEINRLNRREARQRFNDFLLYESDLKKTIKEDLQKRNVFLDSKTVIIGQTGFLSPDKQSEMLYAVRGELQRLIPGRRVIALRIGSTRDSVQEVYAENLIKLHHDSNDFLIDVWLPQNILPLAQRAFDINFYWPNNCTQSGVLAHALGAGAIIAGRDLEGVGETLKEAGEIADTSLWKLLLKIKRLILNPDLQQNLEETVREYAARFSWKKQARIHYELGEHVLSLEPAHRISRFGLDTVPVSASGVDRDSSGLTATAQASNFSPNTLP